MFNRLNCLLTDEEINKKARELLGKMTLKEKVWLLNGNWDMIKNTVKYKNPYNPVPIKTNGNKRLGILPIAFSDGPRGVVIGHATCFPVSMARGASFDTRLERRVGDAIGKEVRASGANYYAGVCINLLRHPAWGRAQETYGEDTYLLGEMGKALTQGVQEHNVMACLKHFALNSIENTRFDVDISCSSRTLHEVYLPHFKKCIDAGAASVMGAYNKFRGDYCCESDFLLTHVLRHKWGFKGFTSSDFLYGIRDTKKAIEAGMDVEMPMPIHYQRHLLKAIEDDRVSEDTLNASVLRVLNTQLTFMNTRESMDYKHDLIACDAHRDLARKVSEKSMVLIKNENSILPFSNEVKKVLVVGSLAKKGITGDHGSSRIYAPYVVTALEGIKNYVQEGTEVLYCKETEVMKAKRLARAADCVIIMVGNDYKDEGEHMVPQSKNAVGVMIKGLSNQGMWFKSNLAKLLSRRIARGYTGVDEENAGGDRGSLMLKQNHKHIIEEIGRINPYTVVCLVGGSMIMTKGWEEYTPAILYSWYSGMEGGNALPRLLFGDVSPSGKLPFTIPNHEEHLPYFSKSDLQVNYDYYHGYTLLDKKDVEPAYAFGYGLSYTRFSYKNHWIERRKDKVYVGVTICNDGHRQGEDVIQVYMGMQESAVERPIKLLKAFKKVRLLAGEEKEFMLSIPLEELRYYNEEDESWILEKGIYTFSIGNSSHNDHLHSLELDIV